MNKKQILQKLKNDEDYYGEFGNQFISNSHVGRLLKDPLRAFESSKPSPAFLVGGYFHTCILEPDKIDKYKVVKSTTRNTKAYKDVAGGELCLLQHEVDTIELANPELISEKSEENIFNQDTNNENQTQIFENSNSEEETLTKEREMFEETNSEEDFEIPAFLRRQKN